MIGDSSPSTDAQADARLAVLASRLVPHGRLRRAWPLTGGISAAVTALVIEAPDGGIRRFVVRRHGPADVRCNPRIAADEFRLLRVLSEAGLPVQRPAYLDDAAEIFATPSIVLDYVAGATDATPRDPDAHMRQLAEQLASIHALDGVDDRLSFLPRQDDAVRTALSERPADPAETRTEGRIRQALNDAWPLRQRHPTALLHGDFWPGNLLWRDERLVAIIDWEDAARGDRLADVANARLEILWALGAAAMARFTTLYADATQIDMTDLPFWDLYVALKTIHRISTWNLDARAEAAMRRGHRRFADLAFARLGAASGSS